MDKGLKAVIDETAEAGKLYIKAETDLLKLRLARGITLLTTQIAVFVMLSFTFMLVAVFLGLASAMWLQQYMELHWAYLTVAGIFLVVSAALYLLRHRMLGNRVLRAVIKEMFDESQV
jgi:hypothetical protein